MFYYYCKKCGRVICEWHDGNTLCDHCKALMYLVPEKYIRRDEILTDKEDARRAIVIREELVKPSPEFDQELFEHLDEFEARERAEGEAALQMFKAAREGRQHQPECPTCHSKNIQRISGLERGASVALFGLFSKKINKSFKCNSCGYTW